MGFWIFMVICNLLIPLTMIFVGRCFERAAPKKINNAYGYRTKMSMKNFDTWQFAHTFSGRVIKRVGFVVLPVTALASVITLLVFGTDENTVGLIGGIICFAQMIPLIVPVILTEIALRQVFDSDGNRLKTGE